MSLKLSTLICLLRILAAAPEPRAFAAPISHSGAQYYANATDIVSSEILESPFPYNFPDQRDDGNLFPIPDCNGLVLEEATVDYLQEAMKKGQLTSRDIALCYIQRIHQTNDYTK